MSEDLDRNFARIVKLAEAAGLPEVSVGTSYGTPALLVKDKSFARMKDDEMLVRLSEIDDGSLTGRLIAAWREKAPKKLSASFGG